MHDLISRQAAVDALDVLCQEHRYRIPGKRETYSQYNEAWQDALGRAECAIGDLPSAQQWIPVTERLPCESDMVLATCGYRNVQNTSIRWVRRLYLYGGTWRYPDDEVYTEKVYAWMPLPEPYRTEGDGDNVHKPD